MTFYPDHIYHISNQGNNSQTIFFKREDYLLFLTLYASLISPNLSTIAWCLMPNHFRFMVLTGEKCCEKIKQGGIIIDPVTNGIRKLLSGYARIFNSRNNRTGSVFRQKTKAKCLSPIPGNIETADPRLQPFINCFHYIHQIPFVTNLVSRLEDWEFSSFRDYAGLRDGKLCRKDLAATYCGYQPGRFIQNLMNFPLINDQIL